MEMFKYSGGFEIIKMRYLFKVKDMYFLKPTRDTKVHLY